MKKNSLLLLTLLLCMFHARSQHTTPYEEHIFNERYETAKNVLLPLAGDQNLSTDARYWLAEIYLKEGQIDSAEQIINEGLEILEKSNIKKEEARLLLVARASLLLEKGNTTEAKQQFEDLLMRTKYKDVNALWAVAKANIESKNGDVEWAVELLEKAMKRDKRNSALYISLGDAYRRLSDGGKAVTAYDEAVRINDANAPEALHKIGKIYKTQGNSALYTTYFNQALAINPDYAPSLYEMYSHYFYRDVFTAKKYLDRYIVHADPSIGNDYMIADLHYVSKQYQEAITCGNSILQKENGNASQPRIYKLIAHSHHILGDSLKALDYIDQYFTHERPENFVAKDFELKAELLEKTNPGEDLAIEWYKKAIDSSKVINDKIDYMGSIARIEKKQQDYHEEAHWREEIYKLKENPTNLDLYKWGIALYSGGEYHASDSVFTIYQEKYPDHLHGYLMRARCNALIDTSMELGLAVPHYKKLVEEALKDAAANKTTLIRAYGYLGSYEANVTKNYPLSLEYFNKILEIEPGNTDALRYAGILKEWVKTEQESTGSK